MMLCCWKSSISLRIPACLVFALLLAGGCVHQPAPACDRTFNTAAFPGLTSASRPLDYATAKLDYELESATGQPIRFSTCSQVQSTNEADIASPSYPLFRLLSLNCQALKLYTASTVARQSHLPPTQTVPLVKLFPADAVPRLNDEDLARRRGHTLSSCEHNLVASTKEDGSVCVRTETDEITYTLMARGDFNGDGIQDFLVRVEQTTQGTPDIAADLLLLTRTSPQGPVVIIWRH